VVLMELIRSYSEEICAELYYDLMTSTGYSWDWVAVPARDGDREAYGIFWKEGGRNGFNVVKGGNGQRAIGLSPLQFPNPFSVINGRRAACATFRTRDTGVNFTVTVYHAPPSNPVPGIEALARTPQLYFVDNAGVQQAVPGRLLAGDYNLDINVYNDYGWLTNPVPAPPPPAQVGQGAGTAPITLDRTHLLSLDGVLQAWGNITLNWSNNPLAYRDANYDNIFFVSPTPGAPAGRVVDVLSRMMDPNSWLRWIAQEFQLRWPGTGAIAFPQADIIPEPLEQTLNYAWPAWALYRYAISDHLPVFASVTV
jgi:hypothetical protein